MVSQVIDHYRILRRLGAGGMGEVYEAEDLRLGRHAALKFLPDAVANDPHTMERFAREARAASSLDHPNICTIYEVGEHEGRAFLAMQLLEGRTLRECIGGLPMALDHILDIGTQIADALDATHSCGIIHRDIKPSNIFITARGQAKLLDFGLAKMNVPKTALATGFSNGTTLTDGALSSADSVVGTVGYMSPEQALGKELDSRSDLFSLGAVLYEMATGVVPFSGSTSAAIFDSILNKQPVAPLRLNPAIPEELDHIIRKALEKDREVRSQTAAEIRADLKRLKRDTTSDRIALAAPAATAPPKERRRLWAAAGVSLLGLLAAAIWYSTPIPLPKVTASTQITSDSLEKGPLVTDGSRIYFGEFSKGHLVLMQVSASGGESSEIPTPFRNVIVGDISPDRTQLLVGSIEGTIFEAPLWALPLPSGSPRRLGGIMASSTSWSPDGKHLVYTKDSGVYLASPDGTDSRLLVSVKGLPEFVRYSPDGSRIRFTIFDANSLSSSLWEVGSDGNHLHRLLPGWRDPPGECCGQWTSDGRYYFFLTGTDTTRDVYALADGTGMLRRVPAAPVQLTAGPLQFNFLAPSSDNKLFVQATQRRGQLVRYDAESKQFLPYMSGISATDLAFSPDGQWVAYITVPDGVLWRSRVDGTDRLQLTRASAQALLPIWSPDGTHILFQRFSFGEGWKAQTISSAGGAPEDLLPGGGGGVDFNWSPDGNSLIFSNGPEYGPTSIRILDFKTHQLSAFPGSGGLFSPRRSPDGRYLGALTEDSSTLMLYDFQQQKWSKWLVERGNIAFPSWSKDSKYIYFDNFLTDRPTARKVKLGDDHSEEMFSLSGLHRFHGTPSGTWGGLAPDNSRLYVQDLSSQEIYSLQFELR
jgi:eukaryotic-like serine/threonine-protein kinase